MGFVNYIFSLFIIFLTTKQKVDNITNRKQMFVRHNVTGTLDKSE